MIAILINRKLSLGEQSETGKMASAGATVFEPGQYELSEEEKKTINYEVMDTVVSFGDKMFEGKAIADWMSFDESSLWYYHKFRAYFRLRKLKYEIAALRKLSEEHEKVICYTDDPFLSEAGLPANVAVVGPLAAASKKNYFSLVKYFVILISRWLINVCNTGKIRKPDHIIMDVSKRQAFLDMDTLKTKRGNYVIGYLLEKTGKDFLIIDEAVQPKITDGARVFTYRK